MKSLPAFLKKESEKKDLLLAFLLPAAIFIIVLFRFRIQPFGDLTLLVSDLDSQYIEFMAEYRRMLLGEGSFSWSWNAGMGMSIPALTAYYLASPFNFLLVLFPEGRLPLAVSVLTVLKIACAGGAFAFYLQKHYGAGKRYIPHFAVCYALSAWTVGYAFNIMWLDALIWLPLICLGIDGLGNSVWKGMSLLTLFFALSFLSQFYMAWMTGFFSVIYFFTGCLKKRTPVREFLRIVLKFAVSVGVAAGLSAFLLLPAFFVLKNNMGAVGQQFPGLRFLFEPFRITQKFFADSFDGIKDSLPHIYCGLPALLGCFLYFMRRTIPVRERVISGLTLALFLFSFLLAPLDFFWHAMDQPSWFPFRYAFLFIFWMLTLAFEGFSAEENSKDLLRAAAGCCFLLGIAMVAVIEGRLEFLVVNLSFLALYAVIFGLTGGGTSKKLFLAAASLELLLNSALIISQFFGGYARYRDYLEFHDHYRNLTADILPEMPDFYRMEKNRFRNYNDPIGIGFPGISHFSSTASVRQSAFLKRLGFNCYATWCTYQGATAASDALLRIRYEFGESGKQDSIRAADEIFLHSAQFPLFFFAGPDFAHYDFMADRDAITRQNDLLRFLDGSGENYFTEIPVEIGKTENISVDSAGGYQRIDADHPGFLEAKIDPHPGKSLYLLLPGASLNVTVKVNGEELMNGNRDYAPFPICLDAFVDKGPILVRVDFLKDRLGHGLHAYALDTERLAALTETVNDSAPKIERTGYAEFRLMMAPANEERLIVSSIPFDAGWIVSSGGQSLPVKMIHEGVLGFLLPAGSEEVQVSFRAYRQQEGFLLSSTALLCWFILLYLEIHENRRRT